ncbi:MAG: hypothetical protein HY791_33835 [Deltaproteobacteria bacterium]|nr:hypothetical protein [Deltaproteobacteria bacterium]
MPNRGLIMRSGASWVSLVGCISVGCMNDDVLSAPDGLDLLIVALATDGPPNVSVLRRGESLAAGWESDDPIFFGFSVGDFLRPSGEPVELLDLGALTVRTSERAAPRSGCRRCIAPPFRSPQLVYPGDSCSLPRFGRVFVRRSSELVEVSDSPPAAADVLRRDIRMDWAGTCPFEDEPIPVPPSSIELRAIYPEVDPWPVEQLAQAPDGTLGLFSERLAMRIGADGARTQPGSIPFEGPVELAVGLEGGEFVVVSRIPPGRTGSKVRFTRFNRSFESAELPASQEFYDLPKDLARVDSSHARLFGAPEGLEALLLAGGRSPLNPWVSLCVLGETLSCEPLLEDRNRPSWTLESGRMDKAIALEDGTVVASGPGRLAYGARLDGRWVWRSTSPSTRGLESLGWVGQQVFVCANDDVGVEVLTATITGEMARPEAGEVTWVRRFEARSGSCGDFSRVPGARRLRMMLGAVTRWYVELDADDLSRNLEPSEVSAIGLGREVARLRSLAPNLLVAQDMYGAVLRVAPGQQAEIVYGSSALQGFAGALVPNEGELLGFANRPSHAFSVVKATSGEWQVTESRGIGDSFDEWNDIVTDAKADSSDGSLWLTGYTLTATTVRGWLRHQRGGTWSEVGAAYGVRGLSLAEVAPGRFVLVADNWGIWVIEGEKLSPVEVIWDDPETQKVEGKPAAAGECHDGRSIFRKPVDTASLRTWRAVDANGGSAWAVGCGGVIARVMAYGPRPVAERFGVDRLNEGAIEGDLNEPQLSAVRVLSPDLVLVAAVGLAKGTSEQGRLWEIRPAGAGLTFAVSAEHRPPVPALEVASGPPLAIVGPAAAAALVNSWSTEGSVQYVGSSGRARFPGAITAAASDGRDVFLAGWGMRVLVASPGD